MRAIIGNRILCLRALSTLDPWLGKFSLKGWYSECAMELHLVWLCSCAVV